MRKFNVDFRFGKANLLCLLTRRVRLLFPRCITAEPRAAGAGSACPLLDGPEQCHSLPGDSLPGVFFSTVGPAHSRCWPWMEPAQESFSSPLPRTVRTGCVQSQPTSVTWHFNMWASGPVLTPSMFLLAVLMRMFQVWLTHCKVWSACRTYTCFNRSAIQLK